MDDLFLCGDCARLRPWESFPKRKGVICRPLRCFDCRRAKQAGHHERWAVKNPGVSRRALLRRYGLTEETYDALLEAQGGVCAICESSCSTGNRLAVDHDHETGEVRGLLCRTCNQQLGVYERRSGQFEAYLADPPARAALDQTDGLQRRATGQT